MKENKGNTKENKGNIKESRDRGGFFSSDSGVFFSSERWSRIEGK